MPNVDKRNYLSYIINEDLARIIAIMMYESANAIWEDFDDVCRTDYEFWYGISKNWDLNIYTYGDTILRATLYRVGDDGLPDTCNGIQLPILDINEED